MKLAFIFLLISTTICTQLLQTQGDCSCENGGRCQKENQVYICKCFQNYFGPRCSQYGIQIQNSSIQSNLSSDFIRFYMNFAEKMFYFVQIKIKVQTQKINSKIQIFLQFEKENGNISNQNISKDIHELNLNQANVAKFKFVILPDNILSNGKLPKLIISLRQKLDSFKRQFKQQQINQQKFTVLQIDTQCVPIQSYNLLKMQNFYIISSFSSLFSVMFAYIVYKGMLKRQNNRNSQLLHKQQLKNDISNFDILMPVFQTQNNNLVQEQCNICLLQLGNEQIRKTPCGHFFHKQCIDEWATKKINCPVCRRSLKLNT